MKYKKFGKLDWNVSQVGYGMWGMAGWSESDDKISNKSLDRAIELGCNFLIQRGDMQKEEASKF